MRTLVRGLAKVNFHLCADLSSGYFSKYYNLDENKQNLYFRWKLLFKNNSFTSPLQKCNIPIRKEKFRNDVWEKDFFLIPPDMPCRFAPCVLPDADKNLNGQEELQMDRQTTSVLGRVDCNWPCDTLSMVHKGHFEGSRVFPRKLRAMCRLLDNSMGLRISYTSY